MFKKLYFEKLMEYFSIFLAAALTLFALAVSVSACIAMRSGPMPICGGLTINPDTDVVVIKSYKTGGLTNVLLGADKHSAEYVNILIGDVPRPVTIIVSHYEAAVLNFSGNVDQVDQVIAMGARSLGWDHVAVTGIDVRKVRYLPVIGHDRNLMTGCSAPPQSCVPEQYFDLQDHERSPLRDIPLNSQYVRMKPTTFIGAFEGSTVVLPAQTGEVKITAETNSSTVKDFRWPETWQEEVERYNKSTDDLKTFSMDQLLSPTTVMLDSELPSWAGILGLMYKGQIRPAGDYDTDRELIQFSKRFNERYRTRFDPDFSFEPHIDFVVSPFFRAEIPRDLRKLDNTPVIFLSNYGLPPAPDAGDTGKYCFFSPDYRLTQPRFSGSNENTVWKRLCKPYALGGPNGLSPTLASLQLDAAISLENHKQWNTQLCPLIKIPPVAEVVVLSTQHGRLSDGVRFKHCDIETSLEAVRSTGVSEILGAGPDQCDAGEVDVRIDRSGPMFLFLKGRGALKWNFEVSAESDIVGVVTINDRRQSISGLPEGVPFSQYVPDDRGLPDECRNSLLDASPMAGGPAIQLFEMMLNQTSGRDIDLLFNNGISPDQDSQTPERVSDYTTFVVK